MWGLRKRRSKIVFAKQAVTTMVEECRKAGDLETGGVLIGRYVKGRIFVKVATPPGPSAQMGRVSFRCDVNYCNRLINLHFLETFGEFIYLGDWHRHPGQKELRPSPRDDNAMSNLLFDRHCAVPEAVLVIADSGTDHNLRMAGYFYTRTGVRRQQLRVCIGD